MPYFCDCNLSSAIERLYAAKYPALIRSIVARARSVENADPWTDPKGFAIHMEIEETFVRPHLEWRDQEKMDTHHAIFRRGGFSRAFFDAHAAWESDLFATLPVTH